MWDDFRNGANWVDLADVLGHCKDGMLKRVASVDRWEKGIAALLTIAVSLLVVVFLLCLFHEPNQHINFIMLKS